MSKGIWDQDSTWDTGDDRTEEGKCLTWADIKKAICDVRRNEGKSDKYVDDLGYTLDRAIEWCSAQQPPLPPQRFGKLAAEKFLAFTKDEVAAKGKSDGTRTARKFSVQLKMVFKWLYMEGLFPKSNLERLKNPSDTGVNSRPRLAMTKDEYTKMMEENTYLWSVEHNPSSRFKSQTARDFHRLRNACVITLMIDGGMRRKEACLLPLAALDMEKGFAYIPANIIKNNQERAVPLSREFIDGMLAEYLALRERVMKGYDDHGNIFINEKRGIFRPENLNRRFNRIRDGAGIKRPITPHSCRRTGSTALDTVDRETSKKAIGHNSDAVHDIYHVLSEAEIEKMRRVKDQAGMWGSAG